MGSEVRNIEEFKILLNAGLKSFLVKNGLIMFKILLSLGQD